MYPLYALYKILSAKRENIWKTKEGYREIIIIVCQSWRRKAARIFYIADKII